MEQMTADSTPRKPKHPSISRHTGDELQQDLAHLMYNAAQRAKAWVDGRHETKKMRIQRSPSFENAMRIMEQMEQARLKEKLNLRRRLDRLLETVGHDEVVEWEGERCSREQLQNIQRNMTTELYKLTGDAKRARCRRQRPFRGPSDTPPFSCRRAPSPT